ncbi:hypothetical protein Kpho02_69800 [Kitasatospora phosalacinea]|uniref:Serine peptidase n=1 Tax=Kitasatospora phosalacinea TaxID=2065 RepID=A0A9W6QHR1_9ACTN|nr:hypothetical protein [Kitasatospora phosalacinea]GLW74682.1 hypothetical protein Kpho02_69800 [Kitasatospora phosalacinea]
MAPVVLVHGIFNYVRGATPDQAALRRLADCRPKLAEGLGRLSVDVPELVMAYYADLLRLDLPEQAQATGDDATFDDLTGGQRAEAAEWLATAGAPLPPDPQNVGLAPLRQMLGWLIGNRGGHLVSAVREQTMRRVERAIVTNLREVEAYTSWSNRRQLVRERIAAVIRREQPTVVVAHSLGSFVTYETLHAFPELEVELLVTVGSPLRVPSLSRRLEPGLRGGRGASPAGVERWINIADVGDLVAIPPKLGEVFPVDFEDTCDNGLGSHGFGGYLASGLVAAAIAPYLS